MKNKKRRLKKEFKVFLYVFFSIIFTIVIIGIVFSFNDKSNDNGNSQSESDVQNQTSEVQQTTAQTTTELVSCESESVKSAIQSIMAQNGLSEENFAFFYYNTDTLEYYFYNDDKYFKAASTVKVPVAMLYYDMINSGELSEDDTIIYTSDCYEAGDGYTASTYSVSSAVPISFLLEQAIVNSDNTAVNILIKNLGYTNCKQMMAQYASDIDFPDEFYSSNLTRAKFGFELLSNIYENLDDYDELVGYMKQSSFGEYLKKYLDVDVAHKYGSYDSYVHDFGIVFDDTTYFIGVYTYGVADAAELIAQISLEINNIV